ncbi:hypothetical protein OROGR_015619 [Orobanche gracilis]
MAMEVLWPGDLLTERFYVHPTLFHRRGILPPSEDLTDSVAVNRKQQRKTSPPKPGERRSSFPEAEGKGSSRHHSGVRNPRRTIAITSGGSTSTVPRVTLLRRGEVRRNPSDPIRRPVGDLLVPKKIRPAAVTPTDVYAGSAFSMSPSPRSVPLPSFFNRNDSNDGAARDLRRLLHLE